MQELKRRTSVVYGFLCGPYTTAYRATNVECMVLQVRKILELIALGSLVTHRDVYSRQYAKFAEHWHAARILRDVEKVNANFYPKPIKEVPSERKGVKHDLLDVTEGFLTKQEFVEAYERCGGILHAKNPFLGEQDYAAFDKLVPHWLNRIRCLLDTHVIQLIDSDCFLLVHMREAKDGQVHAYTFGKTARYIILNYRRRINGLVRRLGKAMQGLADGKPSPANWLSAPVSPPAATRGSRSPR